LFCVKFCLFCVNSWIFFLYCRGRMHAILKISFVVFSKCGLHDLCSIAPNLSCF
jgi:hypothetical protein